MQERLYLIRVLEFFCLYKLKTRESEPHYHIIEHDSHSRGQSTKSAGIGQGENINIYHPSQAKLGICHLSLEPHIAQDRHMYNLFRDKLMRKWPGCSMGLQG